MQILYKFCEIYQKSLMSTCLLNVPPEPKFWRRHCSTGREEFMYEILSYHPPEPKSWRRLCLAPQILGSRKPHASPSRRPIVFTPWIRATVIFAIIWNLSYSHTYLCSQTSHKLIIYIMTFIHTFHAATSCD